MDNLDILKNFGGNVDIFIFWKGQGYFQNFTMLRGNFVNSKGKGRCGFYRWVRLKSRQIGLHFRLSVFIFYNFHGLGDCVNRTGPGYLQIRFGTFGYCYFGFGPLFLFINLGIWIKFTCFAILGSGLFFYLLIMGFGSSLPGYFP